MRYVILNCSRITNRRELYDAVAEHLPIPEYFGRNLDALHEVILLDILPTGRLTLEILDYETMKSKMGGYAVGLVGGGNTDVSGLEKDVAAIREQGDRTQYVDGQGNTVIRYKNLTRKIYKN